MGAGIQGHGMHIGRLSAYPVHLHKQSLVAAFEARSIRPYGRNAEETGMLHLVWSSPGLLHSNVTS